MIVERSRLGQLLVATGSVAVVVALLVIGGTTLARSTSRVSSATEDLLAIEEVHDAIVDELAASLPTLFAPGRLTPDTAIVVAERIARDSSFVEGSRGWVADAHRRWLAGEDPEPTIPSDVLVPVAIAALRDVDLALARDVPADATLVTAPVQLTIEPASTVSSARNLGVLALIVGLALLAVGAVLDRRSDRVLRRAAAALLVLAGILAVAAVVIPLIDLTGQGPAVAGFAALIGVARTPMLAAAAASALLGGFLRAWASQVAPLVDARERRRTRRLAGPAVAASGTQPHRWRRGRAVRQQAIDAFFEEDGDEAGSAPAAEPSVASAPTDPPEQPLVAYRGDGFDQAIAAVEADPRGGTTSVAGGEQDDDDEDAANAAADRREALERIDGARSRLRTHLPR